MSSIPKGARKPTHQRNEANYAIPMLDTSGQERAAAGIIASVRNQKTGECVSLHEFGPVIIATRAIAAAVDRLGADWKIVALSTPHSIYRDLQGTRNYHVDNDDRHPGQGRKSAADPRTAEMTALGRIGRLDLLAPLSLTPHTPER